MKAPLQQMAKMAGRFDAGEVFASERETASKERSNLIRIRVRDAIGAKLVEGKMSRALPEPNHK
jgi:hypothetical protein